MALVEAAWRSNTTAVELLLRSAKQFCGKQDGGFTAGISHLLPSQRDDEKRECLNSASFVDQVKVLLADIRESFEALARSSILANHSSDGAGDTAPAICRHRLRKRRAHVQDNREHGPTFYHILSARRD